MSSSCSLSSRKFITKMNLHPRSPRFFPERKKLPLIREKFFLPRGSFPLRRAKVPFIRKKFFLPRGVFPLRRAKVPFIREKVFLRKKEFSLPGENAAKSG
jgi:hypothetical protein